MIVYFTFSENPSGIYSSQVIDTCKYLSMQNNEKVKLLSIISIRGFIKNRSIIKSKYKNSLVLPMFPKLENWKLNYVYLFLFTLINKNKVFICRNCFSAVLSIKLKDKKRVKKVIYDGRGCEYEQIKEYNVIENRDLTEEIRQNEIMSCNESDFQLSVSEELIDYWRENYNYTKSENLVIPCSLNSDFEKIEKGTLKREDIGFSSKDIILVYSGSVSGWQSFSKMMGFFEVQMKANEKVKILMLSKQTEEVEEFISKYPDRVKIKWCEEKEVLQYLGLCDYGVIIRDSTVTNFVASPVKFAEYLYAGLKVIINENSVRQVEAFIIENDCGIIFSEIQDLNLENLSEEERLKINKLAIKYYSKNGEVISEKYKKIIKECY